MIKKNDFFSINTINCSKEYLAQNTYILIHTIYLNNENIIDKLSEKWIEKFGINLGDETFNYLSKNNKSMLSVDTINKIKLENHIYDKFIINDLLVALEFDIWLIRTINENRIDVKEFKEILFKNYGDRLSKAFFLFEEFQLANIINFKEIISEFKKYDKEISEIHFKLLKANKIERKEPIDYKKNMANIKVEKTNIDVDLIEKTNDFNFIIKEKNAYIEKLENDIKEFRRQRDEAREFSVQQYDKGIKDLFLSLNDIRYGRIIDNFYNILHEKKLDEKLFSYLENFFMVLEDFEIEPILDIDKENIQKEKILKNFNLKFDINDYDNEELDLVYFGWKYKDNTVEKPTLKKRSYK